MLRRGLLLLFLALLLLAAGATVALYHFSMSALNEPGRMETYLVTKAKFWIISRSARGPLPQAPPYDARSVAIGQMAYGGECANCHGVDGRTPTDIGRWMYPRTLALDSAQVQQWSDAELFWIVKNGIRLSGMPGFGKIHKDEQIWHLVHYVRSLGTPPR